MHDIAVPRMREIEVSPDNLILDPNNPRLKLVSGDDEHVPEERAGDPGIVERTRDRLAGGNDQFQLKQLQESIVANGWQPVDFIFVKAHKTEANYLVLEGNRRVMAIRNLLDEPTTKPALRQSLKKIKVMEMMEEDTEEKLQRKISYLLGVRHHGSLQKWSAFAQANNIYLHYLARAKQTRETFRWDESTARGIASALSISLKEVRERLKVFRAMQQIGNRPEVKSGEPTGGMRDTFYSVCGGGLLTRGKRLAKFIKQDQLTFLLKEEACVRMEQLCCFSQPKRRGSPINSPREWRYLSRLLEDDDEQKREANIEKVLNDKQRPSDVWSVREEELRKLQWDKWLTKVSLVLQRVELGDEFGAEATTAIETLTTVLMALETKDKA